MSNHHHDRTPPPGADDHVLAEWLATVAGERLLEVRAEGLEGRELKDAGDQAAHEVLMKLLAAHRRDDSVLSEEGADDKARLQADRVWIVDPLDGTREFAAGNDEFDFEPYVGTLENDGVGIAPFHNFEDKVRPELAAELDEVKAGIIDGSIEVESYLG